jgi:hypothetical protein
MFFNKFLKRKSSFNSIEPDEIFMDSVNLPGFDVTWEEIEAAGINFHQAMLLNQKGLLSWMPDFTVGVTMLQYAELRFLFSLLFKKFLSRCSRHTSLHINTTMAP